MKSNKDKFMDLHGDEVPTEIETPMSKLEDLLSDSRYNSIIRRTLFIDTEFVGIEKDFDSLTEEQKKTVMHHWSGEGIKIDELPKGQDYFLWNEKAGLSVFTKIICLTIGYVDRIDNTFKMQSYTTNIAQEIHRIFNNNNFSYICAHSVGADIRQMAKTMLLAGMDIPPLISKGMKTAPWELNNPQKGTTFCTMQMAYPFFNKNMRLADLCTFLHIPSPKDGIDGSMVHRAYYDGELERIVQYCEKDVEAMFACFIDLLPYTI